MVKRQILFFLVIAIFFGGVRMMKNYESVIAENPYWVSALVGVFVLIYFLFVLGWVLDEEKKEKDAKEFLDRARGPKNGHMTTGDFSLRGHL